MSGKPESRVVSGGGGGFGFRSLLARMHPGQRAGLFAAAIVVVAGIFFGYQYFAGRHKQQPVSQTKTFKSTSIRPVHVDYVQMNDADIMKKIEYLQGTNQYPEAEKLLLMQKDLNSDSTKLQLLMGVQNAEDKKADANNTAKKLGTLGNLSPGQYELIGDQFASSGNKVGAKTYYQKAIDAYNMRKIGPYEDEVAAIQAKIKDLGQ